MFKLFLDDVRRPIDCINYMQTRIGRDNLLYLEAWNTVKNYNEFVEAVEKSGVPDIVSFDHDLSIEHYALDMEMPECYDTCQEKTGYDCLRWLISYCIENGEELPKMFFHTANPVGLERMQSYVEHIKRRMNENN